MWSDKIIKISHLLFIFLLLGLEHSDLGLNILHVPDHDEAPVVSANYVAPGELEGADRMCVSREYSYTNPISCAVPQAHGTVKTSRP